MKPATDTSADIENDVSPKKERKFISSEESPNKNRLISLLDNISVNSVSSLDLSLDPQDPRLLNDLTIHSDSSMNRAGLCGELESLNLCDSSIGDETLKDMKKLMLSDVSVNANKRFDESVNSTEHMGKYEDKESVSNVVVGDRKITQNAEMVLHRENNARFAKKYYIPLSENDLYTDDDSTMIENINGNPSKHIPSIDSGFVSSVRNCSVKTPIKQCMPIKNSNSMKNRLLIDKFDPSDSVVAQSRNNPEHFELNTTYICRDVSPTSLPVHPDFYCSPRTSSRCLESSLSSSGLSNHSDMSMTPEVYTSPCTSESAKQEDVPCIEMVSELSGVCRLDTTQRSTQKQHRVMESRNATYRQSLVEDTEVAKDVQNTDSETVAKEEVFCSSMLPFPQNGTSDHSKSTIFDCPSVNTPVSSVKNSFDLEKSKKELSSQTGNASVSKCCMQLVPLFDVQKAGKKKEDNVFVVSTDSKNSTCSCAEKRMNRVYSDSEGGISLVEVHLPKDDQNCSIHSESLSDKYEDSTLVLDWREQEEDSSKLSRHISTCTPVKNLQTPVKQQFLSSSPSLHKEDESYSDSTVLSTASSVQVCVSDEIKSLRDRDLRRALEAFGERPGPITISTRKAYEIRLARLQSEPATSVSKREEDVFCPELCQALNGQFILQPHDDLEISLTKMFEEPNPKKQYREGTKKTSFNYLLLDPRVTQNLPARAQNLTEEEGFEVFVKSIFYVGKGKRSRPYAHFKEAIRHITGKAAKEVSKKVLHIVKIWEAGLGVVSLHVFQNIIPTAAYTREACLIEALGLKRLTNIQRGQFYENVASWSAKKKRQAGVVLLKKAYKIFILEGERQIRAYDIKDIT